MPSTRSRTPLSVEKHRLCPERALLDDRDWLSAGRPPAIAARDEDPRQRAFTSDEHEACRAMAAEQANPAPLGLGLGRGHGNAHRTEPGDTDAAPRAAIPAVIPGTTS